MDKNNVVLNVLLSKADTEYREFSAKLIPNIQKERIIGVRIPKIREIAKKVKNGNCKEIPMAEFKEFLESPHFFLEENNLHAFYISLSDNFDECMELVEAFLPSIDNWATCDSLRPSVFKKDKKRLLTYINKWLMSEESYTVRFAVNMIIVHFMEEEFNTDILYTVLKIANDDYYVKMAVAWLFATSLAKKYDDTVKLFENKLIQPWICNKAISKAIESYRISDETKQYLKTLKR